MTSFLKKCNALTELKLEDLGSQGILFSSSEITKVPFKLKTLDLNQKTGHLLDDADSLLNMMDFLKLHEKSLQNLSFNYNTSDEIYQQVFTGFKSLSCLHLDLARLPMDVNFYKDLSPLVSVKELTLSGGPTKHAVANQFFKLFPSLERLDMLETSTTCPWLPKFTKKLPSFHKNLRHFSFPKFQPGTSTNILFQDLRSLTVKSIPSDAIMSNFVMSHRDLAVVRVISKADYKNTILSLISLLRPLRTEYEV